jgi:hypothetical protein
MYDGADAYPVDVTGRRSAVQPDFVLFFRGATNALGLGLFSWVIFGAGLYEALKSL